MANYCSTARTNYFRVTDEEEYINLFEGLYGYEDAVHDFTEERESTLWHGFGSYSSICWRENPNEEPETTGLDEFYGRLQKILPDDEAFIYMEAGAEKLRYVVGAADIVTNKGIRTMEMTDLAIENARQMLNNPDFRTKVSY